MFKTVFNKQRPLKFTHFTRKGYALFACLGREVLVGTLSVATLTYAKAEGISTDVDKANPDSLIRQGETLGEVDITATRAPLAQSRQARMVTVLSREEIQAAPVQSVNDLLKYAVGVDVRQRGAMGAQTDVSIRGGNDEQITVLLNGINICDPQTGHNAFDFPVDISDIERIEVLEGPAGRVYGTSSLLGAINIVTRKPTATSVDAHVEGGSYGYLSLGARGAWGANRWGRSLSGTFTRSDGYTHNKAGHHNTDYNTVKGFYQGQYLDGNVRVNWHAGASAKNFGSSTFYSPKFDNQFEHTFKTFTALQAETQQGVVHLKPSVFWNHQYDRFELLRGDESKVPFNYHRTDIYGVNINAWFDWALGRTALGAELRNEDLVSTNLGNALSRNRHIHGTSRDYVKGLNRTNLQFVLEHNVVTGPLTVSAGLVAAKSSGADMNMRVYPGIDASVRLGKGWSVFASYSSSLRMPSFTELFYSVGGHKADPNLKPEELRAVEGGLRYASDGISAKTSVFHNHYTHLIDWIDDGTKDNDGNVVWKSVNYGKINALGVEAMTEFDFRKLLPEQRVLRRLNVSYCFINQDQHEGEGIRSLYALEYLKNKVVTTLGLNLWRQLTLDVSYRFQHRMGHYNDLQGNIHSYGSYGILDANLAWTEPHYTVYVKGNNLLDRDYVDIGNVPQPGTWVMGGVSIKW